MEAFKLFFLFCEVAYIKTKIHRMIHGKHRMIHGKHRMIHGKAASAPRFLAGNSGEMLVATILDGHMRWL